MDDGVAGLGGAMIVSIEGDERRRMEKGEYRRRRRGGGGDGGLSNGIVIQALRTDKENQLKAYKEGILCK